MYIGGHYSNITNFEDLILALEHTRKSGGNIIQIFVGKNTATTITQKAKITNQEAKEIKKICKELNMQIYIHASLSLNLSNPLTGRYHWILDNLIYDMNFAHKIGAKGVTVHLGTKFAERYLLKVYTEESIDTEAIKNMAKSLEYVIHYSTPSKTKLLIETSAGQKNKIATYIEELGQLYKMINKKYIKRIGFTLDTCHIFSAGYDITTPKGWHNYVKLFNKYIGIKHIYLIHLNDSARTFNSHTDVHTNLLHGYLFEKNKETLEAIVRWTVKHKIAMILETRDIKFKYVSGVIVLASFSSSRIFFVT